MKIDEIVRRIRSPEFSQIVFGPVSVFSADGDFYQKTFNELSAAYQELKNDETFNCAEMEFTLGGLCKKIAVNQNSKLFVGSVHEQIAVLEASDKVFHNAIHYFESAMVSTNRGNTPCFEINMFRLKIAAQLVDVHEQMAVRYKSLNLTESAITASDKQIQALSQRSRYLAVVEGEKKKQITMQILQIEIIKKELKLDDAFSQLYEALNSIHNIIVAKRKLQKSLNKLMGLYALPSLADVNESMVKFYVTEGGNFNFALMTFVSEMSVLKQKDTRMNHINSSIFSCLQRVTQSHSEFTNEFTKVTTCIAENSSKGKIIEPIIQNIKAVETELSLLLLACAESLEKIKVLKEAENTKTETATLPLSPETERKIQTTLRM